MASSHKKAQKALRYTLTASVVIGMIIFTGFMSFSGTLLLNGPIYAAIAAFVLGGGIEGQVFAESTSMALLKTLSKGYLKDFLINEKLDALIKTHEEELQKYPFLQSYDQQLQYVQELEAAHDHSKKGHLALRKAKKRLAWMRAHFKKFMLDTDDSFKDIPFYSEFSTLVNEKGKKQFQKQLHRKQWLTRFSWLLNLAAGITCFLVGLHVTQEGILAVATHFGMSLSASALSTGVFGLAIIGGIGYTLLVHNTISDMIHNDTLQKWKRKTLRFFARRTDKKTGLPESDLRYGLRLFGGAFLVSTLAGLGIFATVATAGTWWYAAKAGAASIAWLRNAASSVSYTGVFLMGLGQLAFNIVNSLKSANALSKISIQVIKQKYEQIKADIDAYRQVENKTQFRNPCRRFILCVKLPFKILSFGGHLVAMSVMGDHLEGVNPAVTTGVNTEVEAMADLPFIFNVKQLKEQNGKKKKKKGHDHKHLNILDLLLDAALFPIYLGAAAWDCHYSQKNTDPKPKLTFKDALKKAYFGLPKNTVDQQPELSDAWLQFERKMRANKLAGKCTIALQAAKNNSQSTTQAIEELRDYVVTHPINTAPATSTESPGVSPAISDKKYIINGAIDSNRFFETHPSILKSPKAEAICKKMIALEGDYSRPLSAKAG